MDVLVLVWKIKIFICEQKLKDQIVIPCTGQLKLKTSLWITSSTPFLKPV